MDRTPVKFTHRDNGDGTFDSICWECFTTIATANCEGDLEKPEQSHACEPSTRDHYAQIGPRVPD
ncbi:MAG TPA: hypothetical protein VKB38_23150 [Terracidiphilus sp.]|nr:hypothetical protein [Terracidiphilus sp.]